MHSVLSMFYVTEMKNVPAIKENGIKAQIVDGKPAIFLFSNIEKAEEAAKNWLGVLMNDDVAIVEVIPPYEFRSFCVENPSGNIQIEREELLPARFIVAVYNECRDMLWESPINVEQEVLDRQCNVFASLGVGFE